MVNMFCFEKEESMSIKDKKIYSHCYISTYYQFNNYGTRLQNYALSYTINKFGINTTTISIINLKVILINKIKNICSFLPVVHSKQLLWKDIRKKRRVFKSFNKNLNLKNYTYSQLYKMDFTDSIGIVGSDQVWSPNHLLKLKKDRQLYFLNFLPNAKKYAYAPSFGTKEIPDNMIELYKNNLKNFERISIREYSGQEIISKILNIKVDIVPDPVFLLTKEQWLTNFSSINNTEKYIVIYFLEDIDFEVKNKIIKYSNENNLKVICISGNTYCKKSITPSPNEFVELIANASIVFTDSFHGCAFSIIMNTPFFVFKRKKVEQFSRIENLLNKYNCTDSIVENISNFNIDKYIQQYNLDTSKILFEENKKGHNFLKEILKRKD